MVSPPTHRDTSQCLALPQSSDDLVHLEKPYGDLSNAKRVLDPIPMHMHMHNSVRFSYL